MKSHYKKLISLGHDVKLSKGIDKTPLTEI